MPNANGFGTEQNGGFGQAPAAAPGGATTSYRNVKTTLAAAAADLAATTLDGDADGDYLFKGKLIIAAGIVSTTIEFQPNALTTNLLSVGDNTANGPAPRTDWKFSTAGSSPRTFVGGDTLFFMGRMVSKTGNERVIHVDIFWKSHSGGTFNADIWLTGVWTDTTTKLTSIHAVSSAAAALDVGSYIQVNGLGQG